MSESNPEVSEMTAEKKLVDLSHLNGARMVRRTKALTNRQREVLQAIVDYRAARGYSPTLRELGAILGIGSTNGVNDNLKAIERKGYIRRDPIVARGIVVLREPEVRA